MTDDSNVSLEFLRRKNIEPPQPQDPLIGGSGGGTGDGMEARVAKLESDVEYIKRDVAEIKGDVCSVREASVKIDREVGVLIERVSHLPKKGFIVTVVLTTLAVIAALVVFQGNLQKLLHLT
jgi:hypothetical protein